MRLRTRLALAFVLLAVAPLALVVPLALRNLRQTLAAEMDSRVSAAEIAARTTLRRTSEDTRRAVEELAESVALEDLAKELHANGGGGRLAADGERLMRSRGLTVLSLFDARGVTLTSGHLPARLGDQDPTLFAVTRSADLDPVGAQVQVRDEAGLRSVPALVTARPMDYGELRIWVVGGRLLDTALAQHLASLTGAEVEISSDGAVLAMAGSRNPPEVERLIDVPPAQVRLAISQQGFRRAEAGVARAFELLVAVGLAFSVLLALFVSRRITRPVEALTGAARQVAAGDLDAQVVARASGEVGELVGAFNRMTSELKSTTARLVASERVAAWQEVARRLAHEIKNPLTPIQMSLETLLAAQRTHNPRFESLFQESAGAVLEEVERLRRIVDEFSRFARLPKPQLARLDLGELVEQVAALFASAPEGIRFEAHAPRGVAVEADRDQLTQVLVNLVKNAEEAMPGGGTLRLRVSRNPTEAWLEVEDAGPGIPPADRARIFEPYFTTKAGGTGLGLAIAARICQEHGGSLEVDDAPGGGAVFRLRLPAAKG